jgi:hypothetical protein
MKRLSILLALLPLLASAADVKISALPAGTTLAGTEAIPAVQSAATVKTTPSALSTYVVGQLTSANVIGKWSGTCSVTTFLRGDGACATTPAAANPTGTAGLTAVNGSAATFMRSDGAPAISQAIVPTWTGIHTWSLAEPRLKLNNTTGGVDSKLWDIDVTATDWALRTRTDADGAGVDAIRVKRSGVNLDGIAGIVVGNSTLAATMTIGLRQVLFDATDETDFTAKLITMTSNGGLGSDVLISSNRNVDIFAGQDGLGSSIITIQNDFGDVNIQGGGTDGDISLTTVGTGTIDLVGASVVKGTKFTATGCSNGTTVGGRSAGSFVSGTTGTCTVVITLPTAPNGWACAASDVSTAVAIPQSATSTTSCTISGVTTSGNVVVFQAIGY